MQQDHNDNIHFRLKSFTFKDYCIEAFLGFSFALLMAMAYFGSGFELEFIYQGF